VPQILIFDGTIHSMQPTMPETVLMPWTVMGPQGSASHGAAAVSWKISRRSGAVSASTIPGKHDRTTLQEEMDGRLPDRTEAIKWKAEVRAADNAGPKMIRSVWPGSTTKDRDGRGERYVR
jgi:hypothetical protein